MAYCEQCLFLIIVFIECEIDILRLITIRFRSVSCFLLGETSRNVEFAYSLNLWAVG